MDRSLGTLTLQAIAVVCTYLVLSITTASAVEISIYQQVMQGTSPTTTGVKEEVTINPNALLDKSFEFVHQPSDYRWENVQVKISAIGREPLYPIKKIFLFKCKDTNPLDCVDYEPVVADSYLSGEKGTFYWRDVSRGRQANFLTLVKFNHDGEDFWVGYWDEAERDGVQNFEHVEYDIADIDVYAAPGVDPEWVKDFIEKYYMIPSGWMDRATIGSVNGRQTNEIFEIVADSPQMNIPMFEKYKPSSRIIEPVPKDFLMAFAKGSISNPVTFYNNELPTCDGVSCDVGENPANCCRDCGCPDPAQQCTSSSLYPSGECHVCGDGYADPVENSTNCCADAGCPAGLDCNTLMNIPYGKCVTPQCGNNACEPSEDSSTCPLDCYNTPGKRCSDIYGAGYYYDQARAECILAECGERGCEPGEDYSSCCADCADCPGGQYCNTDTLDAGVCMLPSCNNAKCEPGEDYTNCCADCNDCPPDPDTGQLQTCTANVCHLCGNGRIESPVETSQTCCQDTGCIEGYCSVSGACTAEPEMGLRVSILPETVDCTQAGEVDVRFTLVNGPAFLNTFESISYTYENSRYRLSQCVQQGNVYVCKLPISGPDTFPGCFEYGPKTVDFSALLTYFIDSAGEVSNDLKYKEVTVPLTFEVTRGRQRTCNKNGACEADNGENSDYCCWDCLCEDGLICTAGGCKNETQISLVVNPEDLPARNNIDCAPRNGMPPTGDFTFRSHVQNVPESAYESFNVLNWKLTYNNRVYTQQNIPGFSCNALTTEMGHHTGDVECSVPVSQFPACPNPPSADMKLTLNVLGGGLSSHYAQFEGKAIDSEFSLDYVQGLPMCGNNEPNPELGETNDNCCRDMGCPDGKVCTLYSGCVDKGQVDLAVSIDPQSIDCSREPQNQRGNKKVIILAEVTKKPFSPSTAGIEFGDAYLDDSRIEEMGGMCEPVVNSSVYSIYAWRCSIPVNDFNPFCWGAGDYVADFETTIAWQDNTGNRITKRITKPVSFEVGIPRERQCVPDGFQDPHLGEILDQCCPDAGCSGDFLCTKDIICVSPAELSLIVDDVSPNSLDCSIKDDPDNMVAVTVNIENMPYDTQFVEWLVEFDGNTFTEQYFSCNPLTYGGIVSSSYRCEIPVHYFPACSTAGTHDLNLKARVTYNDYRGQIFQQEVSDGFSVNVGRAGLPNCGNMQCDNSLGETNDNCCMDCGCQNENDVCSVDGSCYDENQITMTISPLSVSVPCQLAPWDMDTYAVKSYQCVFQDQITLGAHLNHKPWLASVMSTSYQWDGKSTYADAISPGEEIADGWNLYAMLNPSGDYVVHKFAAASQTNTHNIKDVSLTLQIPSNDGGYERIIKVTSANTVKVNVEEVKNADLLELEEALADAKEAMEKANRIICTIVTILAICTMCSLMSGAVTEHAAEDAAQSDVDKLGDDALKESGNYDEWKDLDKDRSEIISKYEKIENNEPRRMVEGDNDASNKLRYNKLMDFDKTRNQPYFNEGLKEMSKYDTDSWAYDQMVETYGKGDPRTATINLGKQSLLDKQKNEHLANMAPRQTNTQQRSNSAMNMFSTLSQATSGMNRGGALVAGGLAGLAFWWIEKEMLECDDKFETALGVAALTCGIMMFAAPQALKAIEKTCDVLSQAVQMLMMVINLQNTVMQYQACMMQAESYLSQKPTGTETGYERSRRMSDYYKQLAACHTGLDSGMNDIMEDWSDFSYDLAQNYGGAGWKTAVTASPAWGNTIGPGSSFKLQYNFPSYRNQGSYGRVNINFNYRYENTYGAIPGTTITKVLSLSNYRGEIICSGESNGFTCTGGSQIADMKAAQCVSHAPRDNFFGNDMTRQQMCENAALKGTISVTWEPCERECAGDYYFSELQGATTPTTDPAQPQGIVTTTGCCQYTESCETASSTKANFRIDCTTKGGKYISGKICGGINCISPTKQCTLSGGKDYSSGDGFCMPGGDIDKPPGVLGNWRCCQNDSYFTSLKNYCTSDKGLEGCWCDGGKECREGKALAAKPQFVTGEWKCCQKEHCFSCLDYNGKCKECLLDEFTNGLCKWAKATNECIGITKLMDPSIVTTDLDFCDTIGRECDSDIECNSDEVCLNDHTCFKCSDQNNDCGECLSKLHVSGNSKKACIFEVTGGTGKCIMDGIEHKTAQNHFYSYYVIKNSNCNFQCDNDQQCDDMENKICLGNVCQECNSLTQCVSCINEYSSNCKWYKESSSSGKCIRADYSTGDPANEVTDAGDCDL